MKVKALIHRYAHSDAAGTPPPAAPEDGTLREAVREAVQLKVKPQWKAYVADTKRVTLDAASLVNGGVSAVLKATALARGLPGVGSIINACSAAISTGRACLMTSRMVKSGNKDVPDMVAAWSRVATDVAGIFFPPVGLAGSVGSSAYAVYDFLHERRSSRAQQEDGAPAVAPDAKKTEPS